MTREIKFRAWDVENKYMMDFSNPPDAYAIIAFKNILSGERFITNAGKKTEIIPMQYTGLKDKNGTEIYEGDILNHHYHKEIGDIRWQENRATFLLFYTDGLKDGLLSVDSPSYEVIGNIYQNPELLPA